MSTKLNDALALASAIRSGDIPAIRTLLSANDMLASAPLGGSLKTRTALHVVSDWPGYFPNGPEVVLVLVQ